MWCLKRFGKFQDRTFVLKPRHDDQILQDRKFLIDGHDELLQISSRQVKTDATDAITLPESKDGSLFIFCGDVRVVKLIDDEWKGR
jgi:hypothetical protein